MSRQDLFNVALIVVAGVLAHLWPLQTLLGAYAFLGPAHYLTELSWLKDRKFFARRPRGTPLVLLALAGGLVVSGATPLAGAGVARDPRPPVDHRPEHVEGHRPRRHPWSATSTG